MRLEARKAEELIRGHPNRRRDVVTAVPIEVEGVFQIVRRHELRQTDGTRPRATHRDQLMRPRWTLRSASMNVC